MIKVRSFVEGEEFNSPSMKGFNEVFDFAETMAKCGQDGVYRCYEQGKMVMAFSVTQKQISYI